MAFDIYTKETYQKFPFLSSLIYGLAALSMNKNNCCCVYSYRFWLKSCTHKIEKAIGAEEVRERERGVEVGREKENGKKEVCEKVLNKKQKNR